MSDPQTKVPDWGYCVMCGGPPLSRPADALVEEWQVSAASETEVCAVCGQPWKLHPGTPPPPPPIGKFHLFTYDHYYPDGGMEDYRGSYATLDDACAIARTSVREYQHVLDSERMIVWKLSAGGGATWSAAPAEPQLDSPL